MIKVTQGHHCEVLKLFQLFQDQALLIHLQNKKEFSLEFGIQNQPYLMQVMLMNQRIRQYQEEMRAKVNSVQ